MSQTRNSVRQSHARGSGLLDLRSVSPRHLACQNERNMIAAFRSTRTLRRHWKLTAISTFSLSIAMALGIVGLSVSNTILILSPSAPAPDRLTTIYSRSQTNAIEHISYPDYQYYRKNNHVFTDIAAAPNSIGANGDFNFEGRQVSVMSRPVSENYFSVLGIRPFLGRFFSSGDDEKKSRIAVMTYSCWKRLGADPNIVGKVLAKTTIIGVCAEEFHGRLLWSGWRPVHHIRDV